MRFYQMFKTLDDRKAWEKEMKAKHKEFKVCMRKPVFELAKDVYLSEEEKRTYKYSTIYVYWGHYVEDYLYRRWNGKWCVTHFQA